MRRYPTENTCQTRFRRRVLAPAKNGASLASCSRSQGATRESSHRRGRSKNSITVSKFRCALRAVSATNHSGAAVVVLLPPKSDTYPSGCPVWNCRANSTPSGWPERHWGLGHRINPRTQGHDLRLHCSGCSFGRWRVLACSGRHRSQESAVVACSNCGRGCVVFET